MGGEDLGTRLYSIRIARLEPSTPPSGAASDYPIRRPLPNPDIGTLNSVSEAWARPAPTTLRAPAPLSGGPGTGGPPPRSRRLARPRRGPPLPARAPASRARSFSTRRGRLPTQVDGEEREHRTERGHGLEDARPQEDAYARRGFSLGTPLADVLGNARVPPAQGCEALVNENAGGTRAFPGRARQGRTRERCARRKPCSAHASGVFALHSAIGYNARVDVPPPAPGSAP